MGGARNDAFGEVVKALEAAASGDREQTGVEQVLQRRLSVARSPPTPPAFGTLAGVGQVAGAERSAFGDLVVDPSHVHATRRLHVLPRPSGVLGHAVADQRIERKRHEARFVSPEFEQLAFAVRQRVERIGGVWPEARKGRHVVGSDQHVDGIDLEGVHARCEFSQVRRGGPRRACAESLRGDRETARLGERERDRHGLSV
jgi:hypothetical protein